MTVYDLEWPPAAFCIGLDPVREGLRRSTKQAQTCTRLHSRPFSVTWDGLSCLAAVDGCIDAGAWRAEQEGQRARHDAAVTAGRGSSAIDEDLFRETRTRSHQHKCNQPYNLYAPSVDVSIGCSFIEPPQTTNIWSRIHCGRGSVLGLPLAHGGKPAPHDGPGTASRS
jgi:hypothetical protein